MKKVISCILCLGILIPSFGSEKENNGGIKRPNHYFNETSSNKKLKYESLEKKVELYHAMIIPPEMAVNVWKFAELSSVMLINKTTYTMVTGYTDDRIHLQGIGEGKQPDYLPLLKFKDEERPTLSVDTSDGIPLFRIRTDGKPERTYTPNTIPSTLWYVFLKSVENLPEKYFPFLSNTHVKECVFLGCLNKNIFSNMLNNLKKISNINSLIFKKGSLKEDGNELYLINTLPHMPFITKIDLRNCSSSEMGWFHDSMNKATKEDYLFEKTNITEVTFPKANYNDSESEYDYEFCDYFEEKMLPILNSLQGSKVQTVYIYDLTLCDYGNEYYVTNEENEFIKNISDAIQKTQLKNLFLTNCFSSGKIEFLQALKSFLSIKNPGLQLTVQEVYEIDESINPQNFTLPFADSNPLFDLEQNPDWLQLQQWLRGVTGNTQGALNHDDYQEVEGEEIDPVSDSDE